MILLKLTLRDLATNKRVEVEHWFSIGKGLSQKDLFASYQRARAKLGITKYTENNKE